MRHPDYPDKICDISEKSFWQNIRKQKTNAKNNFLEQAVREGLAGNKNKAYTNLARYHSSSLLPQWGMLRREGPPPAIHAPNQTADDAVKHRLYFCRTTYKKYGKKIDWDNPKVGNNLDSFYWYVPVIIAYMQNPREKYRCALCDLINQYYSARNDRRFRSPNYHPVYTALAASLKLRHTLLWLFVMTLIHTAPNRFLNCFWD
jgi:hypothetical protein